MSESEHTANLAHVIADQADELAAQRFVERACEHLANKRYQELRGGGAAPPSTEQQAMAVLRQLGNDIQPAIAALVAAAEELKKRGAATAASQTMMAGQALRLVHQGLVGS